MIINKLNGYISGYKVVTSGYKINLHNSIFNIIFEIKFKIMVTEKLQLKPSVIQEITGNNRIQNRLQLAFDKSYFTIRRWIQDNNPMLTTITALNILTEETGKTTDQLLDS